jgi:hypothetical protein
MSMAAENIALTAKQVASPSFSETSAITLMRMGARFAIHELQLELLAIRKQTISVSDLAKRLRELQSSIDDTGVRP